MVSISYHESPTKQAYGEIIRLYSIADANNWSSSATEVSGVTVSLDNATKKIATIAYSGNFTASSWYEIRVMASAQSQLGMWMGNPMNCATDPAVCLAGQTHYTSSLQTAATADTTQPTIAGSYPSDNDGIANTSVVDVAMAAIEIGFSEAMNPSTITSQSITLKKGTVSAAGTISYDPMSNSARFAPISALSANSVYTLTASTSITDLSGNRLNISSGNNIISFKTGSADTANPNVLYANGDDYQIAVTFSEPMNTALQTDATNWTYSALNPANYYINALQSDNNCANPGSWSCNPTAISPYADAGGAQVSTLPNSNITITYDSTTQTVTLKGFGFGSTADGFQIYIDNVKDKSGNAINDSGGRHGDGGGYDHRNAARAPLQESSSTYGMLGPGGGPGMMMGGGGPGGSGAGGGPGMDMGQMGMFGAGAFPMNSMAGQTSSYMIDIPLVRALQNGMQIVLTFPTGFDVSAVAPDPYSPMNNDMNEWNGGTVTFDTNWNTGVGGIASTTSRVITIKLDIATSSTNALNTAIGNTNDGFVDFLAIDLKGIKNSSIPKDFGTSGYTVDIKTKSSDGGLLENITTMPFFITEGGTNTVTVVVNCGNTGQDTGTMNMFLGSPMTGPMEGETTTFVNGIATSTFSSLPSGDFMIFTDPYITIDCTNYLGNPMPEPFWITGNTTRNITIEQEAANAGTNVAINVYLQGNYSTDQNGDGDNIDANDKDNVDIFANSPMSFRVKTVTPITDDGVGGTDGDASDNNGAANTAALRNATNVKYTYYLTEGDWMMGVGPAMPKGPMAGPPKMPDWMDPQMVNMTVGIEAVTAVGGAAGVGNQNPVNLTVLNLNNFQVGDAISFTGTGAVDNNATTTITAINYTTKIITAAPEDNWGAVPVVTDVITSVRETSGGDNDAKIFFNVANQSLKQIQGYVVDNSGNAISDAEVYAYQPQGFGGGYASTDTSGRFTLKIGINGVWTIGAFKPGLPGGQEKSVEVRDDSGNNVTDGNATADVYLNSALITDANNPLQLKLKRPSYTISGKILNASSTAIAYAPVWAYEPTTWGHADTMTDSSGNYILYVDAGTWTVEADAPGVGWLQYDTSVVISTASQSNINLRPASNVTFHSVSGNISIDGSNQTFIPLRAVAYDANGYHLGRDYGGSTDSNGNYTLSLPAEAGGSYYRIDTWVPGYGEIGLVYDQVLSSPANINVTTATTTADILIATTDLKTISLQFNNGAASQTGFLHIEGITTDDPPKPTGFFLSKNINGLVATSTIKLKTGHYVFFLDVPGLGSYIPTLASRLDNSGDGTHIIVTADRAVYFTLPDANTEMITISGWVTDGTSSTSDAWVWVGNPDSHFHSGTQSDSNGNFTLTVPTLSSGSYHLGADKPGYMPTAPATVSGSQNSVNTITLSSIANNTQTITGYVKNTSGTGLANAMVWAEEVGVTGNLGTGKLIHTQADSNGSYVLPVTDGTWSIMANADGYVKSYYISGSRTDIAVSGTSQSPSGAINFSLTADSNGIKSKSKPITPASGGTLDDTAQDADTKESLGTGIKLTAPPNALGSSASTGNISAQSTAAVTKTNSSQPFKDQGVTVTATDNSGQAINNLDDNMDMQMVIYKADVDAEIASGNLTYAMLKNTNNGYWDSSLDNWVNLTTTRTAYYKANASDNEWTLYATSSTNIFETFIDGISDGSITAGDYKLVFNSQTNHLTIFAIIMPFIATPAQAAPSTPSTATPSTPGSIFIDQSDETKSETKTEQSDEEITTPASAEELYLNEAQIITRAEVDEILLALGKTRDHNAEKQARDILINKLRINMGALEPRHQYALTNFITYGSTGTQRLGSGERAGVINSYKSAFGKLPQADTDWQDVVKIANGRWPNQRSTNAENAATVSFKVIYLRDPNRTNPHDDAAVTVMSYGLRPANRNLNSEKAAIKIFKAIYGYNPSAATAWDVVRAIAYSGATR